MDLAVVSDLHIGKDRADCFHHEESDFLRFLIDLENNYEKIILLGDIFDTLTGPRYGSQQKAFWETVSEYPVLGSRLLSEKYIYVYGNHDIVAHKTVGALSEYIYKENKNRILFTHGHIYDRLAMVARQPADFLIWLGGMLKRAGLNSVYSVLAAADEFFGGTASSPERCLFTQWAVHYAEQRGFDCIITGHTHRLSLFESPRSIYANSGTCSHGDYQFLSINTKTLEIDRYSNKMGVCRS